MRSFTVQQIAEYYNTSALLRPINPTKVNQYAKDMEAGHKFPPIILGQYQGMEGKTGKLIVDGNHVFRALQLAKAKHWVIEVRKYEDLAHALADQLRMNMSHGYQITTAQRNARIKQLIEVYNWSTRQVAREIGVDHSSVSRITRGKQDVSGTGKRGASTEVKRQAAQPKVLAPRQFLRAMDSLRLTLEKPESRAMILAAVYDPKLDPVSIQRHMATLRYVADTLADLVTVARPGTRQQQVAATA